MAKVSLFRRLLMAWDLALESLTNGEGTKEAGDVPIWDAVEGEWFSQTGRYLTVLDLAARDALPAGILHVGLEVYVIGEFLTFKLLDDAVTPGVDPPVWRWEEWRGAELAVVQQSLGVEDGDFLRWSPDYLQPGRGAWIATPPGTDLVVADYLSNISTDTASDPGVAILRLNNANYTAGTQTAFSDTTDQAVSIWAVISGRVAEAKMRIQDVIDSPGRFGVYDISRWRAYDGGGLIWDSNVGPSPPPLGLLPTWHQVDISSTDGTGVLGNNRTLNAVFVVEGSGGVTVTHSGLLDLDWAAAEHTAGVGGAGGLGGWGLDTAVPEVHGTGALNLEYLRFNGFSGLWEPIPIGTIENQINHANLDTDGLEWVASAHYSGGGAVFVAGFSDAAGGPPVLYQIGVEIGDVVGPASSTDNAIARWDGATGKLLQDSPVTIGDGGAVTLQSGANLYWGGLATYIEGFTAGGLTFDVSANQDFVWKAGGVEWLRFDSSQAQIEWAGGSFIDGDGAEMEILGTGWITLNAVSDVVIEAAGVEWLRLDSSADRITWASGGYLDGTGANIIVNAGFIDINANVGHVTLDAGVGFDVLIQANNVNLARFDSSLDDLVLFAAGVEWLRFDSDVERIRWSTSEYISGIGGNMNVFSGGLIQLDAVTDIYFDTGAASRIRIQENNVEWAQFDSSAKQLTIETVPVLTEAHYPWTTSGHTGAAGGLAGWDDLAAPALHGAGALNLDYLRFNGFSGLWEPIPIGTLEGHIDHANLDLGGLEWVASAHYSGGGAEFVAGFSDGAGGPPVLYPVETVGGLAKFYPPNTGTATTQIFTDNTRVPIVFTWDLTNDPAATVRRSDGAWNVAREGRWKVEYSLFAMGRLAAAQWFDTWLQYSTDGVNWVNSDSSIQRASTLGPEQWAQQAQAVITWFDSPEFTWVRLTGSVSTGSNCETQSYRAILTYIGPAI